MISFVSYLHVLTEEVDSLSASSLSSLSKHVIMKTAQTTFNRDSKHDLQS
ncbi:hypothetical protein HMPREF1111_0651 [Streptococcus infantis ATCC 700779]|uniref:Uncharacterized protein n=1 Tax=Streptococcus infantis ATCC 700779 TaxID=889204 RepID=E8K1Q2_9STRE|nr:hypothetical protein HMPREF9423_1415 [Streptococcus infantis ATCC 700779]EIG40576.1 hypothetical protein HMPREF1111_0651 [Streptococcus infantis ATCC 700779]